MKYRLTSLGLETRIQAGSLLLKKISRITSPRV